MRGNQIKMAEKKDKKTISKNATTKKTSKKAVKVVKKASKKAVKVKDTSKLVHDFVPLHEKISAKEAEELFKFHNITIKELPKILKKDAAIRHLNAEENDIIKITRKSPTAGVSVFYRGVINE
jgi:DNA-directed RNA polymerase subunit H